MIAAFAAAVVIVVTPDAARADYLRDAEWHLNYLNVDAAHRISQGQGVIIGLTDTGVDTDHPDLNGVVTDGRNVDGSAGGRLDIDGHGTRMAGDIAGRGHGAGGRDGVLGIAPKASILSVQTVRSDFGGDPRDLGIGITWAVEHGAKVICIAATTSAEKEITASIQAAIKADVVVVAGVGNTPDATVVGFPANLPGVLAVGGVDKNGKHAAISATGPEMAISAPAVDIVTTDLDGRYATATGTSDAAAVVSGAAALVRAKYPDLSAGEVIHRLTATATDAGRPGRDPEYGFGIVNLVAALTAEVPPATAGAPNVEQHGSGRNIGTPIAIGAATALATFLLLAILVSRWRRRASIGRRR